MAKHKSETTALVKFDPNTVVDELLVEDAVEWIRAKVAETISHGIAEIGDYLLDRFFDGDPERVRSQSSHKNASFRSLVARCETAELPVGHSTLYRAVNIAMMRRLVPKGATAFRRLSPTHQAALLPLREPNRVERVAKQALSKDLSVRELKEIVTAEVAKVTHEVERRGRRPRPFVVKALDHSLRSFTQESGRRTFTSAQVGELNEAQRRAALRVARELQESLGKLIERLEPQP